MKVISLNIPVYLLTADILANLNPSPGSGWALPSSALTCFDVFSYRSDQYFSFQHFSLLCFPDTFPGWLENGELKPISAKLKLLLLLNLAELSNIKLTWLEYSFHDKKKGKNKTWPSLTQHSWSLLVCFNVLFIESKKTQFIQLRKVSKTFLINSGHLDTFIDNNNEWSP